MTPMRCTRFYTVESHSRAAERRNTFFHVLFHPLFILFMYLTVLEWKWCFIFERAQTKCRNITHQSEMKSCYVKHSSTVYLIQKKSYYVLIQLPAQNVWTILIQCNSLYMHFSNISKHLIAFLIHYFQAISDILLPSESKYVFGSQNNHWIRLVTQSLLIVDKQFCRRQKNCVVAHARSNYFPLAVSVMSQRRKAIELLIFLSNCIFDWRNIPLSSWLDVLYIDLTVSCWELGIY